MAADPTRRPRINSFDPALDSEWATDALRDLAHQLLPYKPPLNFLGEDDDDDSNGVCSSVTIPSDLLNRMPNGIGRKKAAVLVCLFPDEDGKLRVILTRRAKTLSSHSGEVCLPGGKRDKDDANNAETALREAREEIGLDSSIVRVVTCLEPFLSKHLLRVTPVVALAPDRSSLKFALNPTEVDAVFDAPLEMFLKDENYRCEEREWIGLSYRVHYFDFIINNEHFLIWGLTASILIRCASLIYQQSPQFTDPPAFVPITNLPR